MIAHFNQSKLKRIKGKPDLPLAIFTYLMSFFQIFVPSIGIFVLEIFTHSHQNIVRLVVSSLMLRCFYKFINNFVHIIIIQSCVIFYWRASTCLIIAKSFWRGVVIIKHSDKNVRAFSKTFTSSPHHFHPLLLNTKIFILVINSTKEESIE